MLQYLTFKKALIFFNAFFLLSLNCVLGQNDTLIVIDSLVITASRLPQRPIFVSPFLTPAFQAKLSQGTSVNDYLQAVPGLFTLSPDNYAQDTRITSRGFGARSSFGIRGIKIWVDEIPETTPDGQSQLDNLDFNLIDDIEVLRGPNAALYGNVSGAMIKISQKRLETLKNLIRFRLAYGAYGFKQAGLVLQKSNEKLSFQISYGYHGTDGYRKWSAFENHVANVRTKYRWGKSELTFLLNGVYNPKSQDAGAQTLEEVSTNPKEARQANTLYKAGENLIQGRLGLIYKFKGKQVYYQAKSYVLSRDFDNALPFLKAGKVKINRLCGGVYLEAGNTHTQSDHHWVLGADLQFQKDNRQNYDNLEGKTGELQLNQDEFYDDISLYALNHYKLSSRITGEFHLRISNIITQSKDLYLSDGDQSGTRSLTTMNPTLNLNYQLSPLMGSRIQFSTGFESPTLAELAVNPNGIPGFNQALKASSTRAIEIQLHIGRTQENYFDLQLFYIRGKNELLPFEIANQPGRFYYENIGKSIRRGIELSFRKKLSTRLGVLINHTQNHINGRDEITTIPGIPEHTTQLQLVYNLNDRLLMKYDNSMVGRIYLSENFNNPTPKYLIGNIQMSYLIKKKAATITLTAGINNLYQSDYYNNLRINANGGRYYEGAPGRNGWIRFICDLDT